MKNSITMDRNTDGRASVEAKAALYDYLRNTPLSDTLVDALRLSTGSSFDEIVAKSREEFNACGDRARLRPEQGAVALDKIASRAAYALEEDLALFKVVRRKRLHPYLVEYDVCDNRGYTVHGHAVGVRPLLDNGMPSPVFAMLDALLTGRTIAKAPTPAVNDDIPPPLPTVERARAIVRMYDNALTRGDCEQARMIALGAVEALRAVVGERPEAAE